MLTGFGYDWGMITAMLGSMLDHDSWEIASFVVTVVGLPFGIAVFLYQQSRERRNEEAEIYQRLSSEYTMFMRMVLENPDLGLLHRQSPKAGETPRELSAEQAERKAALFNVLVALFERSYILVYEDRMSRETARLWQSWEDYMREWTRREDFRAALPELLNGEDQDFAAHIAKIAREEGERATPSAPR